jgi:predicted DCC family thiol-disulfide oxidoreductase YuxK
MLGEKQILVVYDGKCGFCSSVVHVLHRLDWRDRIFSLPYQVRGLPEEVGTSLEDAEKHALVFSPSGRLWKGGGSIAACLDALLPLGLPLFRTLYSLPVFHQIGDVIYALTPEYRSKLSIRPADLKHREPPELTNDVRMEIRRRRLAARMPSALPAATAPSVTLH